MVVSLQPPQSVAPTPHQLGGVHHDPDTLANLNSKVSDADLASVAALIAALAAHAGLPTVHQDAPALIAVHAALTAAGIHGSSVAAVVNTLIHRDAAARAKIANPAVAADIDNKGARDTAIETHRTGAVHTQLQPPVDHTHQAPGGGVGGKLDHGLALNGLADDDHPQYIKHSLATAVSDFLVASGAGVFIKKTLAEVKTILGLGTAAYTAATDYVTHALATAANDFIVASGSGTFVKKTLAEVRTLLNWAADIDTHADLTTGIHGVGTGTIAKISTANKTIYIDKGASGANNGTSWADAFESWADCKAGLTGWIIAHDWVIKVRKGATPYRETFDIDAFMVWGTLTIEAEYYWQGDCEANAVAGDIVDTGAFADVAIGDKVFVLDLNGANGRAQDYEVCTVDDISNQPNRIGTDGAKTPSTGWKYTIVRTEISGSDDGTDGGTARNYCFDLASIDKVYIQGFYLTFPDAYFLGVNNSRDIYLNYFIAENGDRGVYGGKNSIINLRGGYLHGDDYLFYLVGAAGTFDCGAIKCTKDTGGAYDIYPTRFSKMECYRSVLDFANYGAYAARFCFIDMEMCTITNGVKVGLKADYNSSILAWAVTNSAATPVDPVGTTEGAYIG